MERWIGVGLGSLALVIGLWNTWTLSTLDDAPAHEATSAAATSDDLGEGPVANRMPPRMARPGAPPMAPAGGMQARGGPPPEIRAKVAEKMNERDSERTKEIIGKLKVEAGAFAQEEHLDAATTDRMLSALEERFETFRLLREDLRTGKIQREDAKTEFQSIREESDAKLVGVLGDARFEKLEDRLSSKFGPEATGGGAADPQ